MVWLDFKLEIGSAGNRERKVRLVDDDLVDRIAKARRQKEATNSVNERIALLKSDAVEQNSDSIWQSIINAAVAVVDKYNKTFPEGRVTIAEREGSPPQGFDVERTLYPIARLAAWRNSPHFIEFHVTRSASFGQEESINGRIDVRADEDRNVYLVADRQVMATPQEVAEYLLATVLD